MTGINRCDVESETREEEKFELLILEANPL